MKRRVVVVFVMCLLFWIGLPMWLSVPGVDATSGFGTDYAHLRKRHARVLHKWLVDKPWLQPATLKDVFHKPTYEYQRSEFGKSFHPYYAVGDFNHDGFEDFAAILKEPKSRVEGAFSLAIFNGPFATRSEPSYFEGKFDYLGNSYLDFGHVEKRRLFLGVYESDYYCLTFYPRRTSYVYRICGE